MSLFAPTHGSPPGGGGIHNLLDGSTHPDTVAQAVSRGSFVYGNATPAWDEFPIGAANTVMYSDGTDPSWSAAPRLANIADPTGVNRIGLAAASPHVTVTGHMKMATFLASIYNSFGTKMVSFYPTGPSNIPYMGINKAAVSTARLGITENAALAANVALMAFALSSTQSGNISLPLGVADLLMSGLHDVSGYSLTILAPINITCDIDDTQGGGVCTEVTAMRVAMSGGAAGIATTSMGLDLSSLSVPSGAAIPIRQRQTLVGAITPQNRLAAPTTIGADAAPATSASLDLAATTGALLANRLTTAQRDALTPSNGMLIYNTTLATFQKYAAGAWASF